METTVKVGKRGEDIALEWLQDRGFRLLDRNWRCSHKEIDLVMESDEAVHIVEVKSMTAPLLVQPYEHVDGRKQMRLASAAMSYISRHHISKEVRFDIVSITFYPDGHDLEYIPDAFIPVYYGK